MGLDFDRYVARRKRDAYGGEEGARYAYSADLAMLATFKRIKPIEMAAAATVRMYKDVMKNQLLGTTIKVTPRQFPSIYKIAEHCADVLDVPIPTSGGQRDYKPARYRPDNCHRSLSHLAWREHTRSSVFARRSRSRKNSRPCS